MRWPSTSGVRYGRGRLTVTVDGDHLLVDYLPKPELIAQLGEDADYHEPPVPIGMLPDGDRYVVPSGPYEGSKGFFTRDGSGRIIGIHSRADTPLAPTSRRIGPKRSAGRRTGRRR